MAWVPVITETHWFGQYEYQEYDLNEFQAKNINWRLNYIESIEIVKTHTGKNENENHRPKTSFYSWLDHKLRFSVDDKNAWDLEKEGFDFMGPNQPRRDQGHYTWNGMGLRNKDNSSKKFFIHNLKAGDKFSIEYYTYDNTSNTGVTFESGNANGLSQGSAVNSYSINGDNTSAIYEMVANGNVCLNIPSKTIIRAIRITLAEYQKAESSVRELGQSDLQTYLGSDYNSSSFGYTYYYTKPGVLEDKNGAVPYITMKFGADNDMTFVRSLPASSEPGSYQFLGTFTELDGFTVLAKNRGGNIETPEKKDYYGSYYYTVNNYHQNQQGNAWACQFWIGHPDLLNVPAGAKVKLKFRRHADDHEQSAVLQAQGPGAEDYISALGNVPFSKDEHWVEYEYNCTVTEAMAGKFQYFTFNLNTDNSDNTFNFADIHILVEDYKTEGDDNEVYGAASIIDASNNLDPATNNYDYLQYRWTYKIANDLNSKFTNAEVRDALVGKEWSTFTAKHDYTVDASRGDQKNSAGEDVVYGDKFLTTFPLCGNFFYFFPEVDGKLVIEYYCEGKNESPAFWWKTDAAGNAMTGGDQGNVNCQQFDSDGTSIGGSVATTNGKNNYYLTADVKTGCVYYFCSLPTNMSHERPILRIKSYSFIPSFRVSPLSLVVNNTTDIDDDGAQNKVKHAAEIFGGPYQNLNVNGTFTRNGETLNKVRYFGNVQSADVIIETEGNRQFLTFKNIKFIEDKNPGGAIVVHLSDACGEANFVLTIGYDAVKAKWGVENGKVMRVQESGTEEVKHWDFYNNTNWDLGKYSEGESSKLWREINKKEEKTPDWNITYVNLPDSKEPIFKSVYDMEADNVDMIHETEGLVIHAHSNTVGIYNENDAPESEFQDRFIGFMPGSKLVIPRLKQNDRVVIKMGTYGNADETLTPQTATLKLNNAKDAKGNTISGDYVIGGSVAYPEETAYAKTQPHGEYHFMVANTSNSDDDDFSIELKDGDLLKIYSIVIYRNAANDNADILTENSITTADGPELLFTDEDAAGSTKDMEFYLRYSGFEEPKTFGDFDNSYTRGNLNLSSSSFTAGSNSLKATFTKGDFGSFRADAQVKTKDAGNTYVTDYTPGSLAVGNLDKMEYPYTWDFTDLLEIKYPDEGQEAKYISNAINTEREGSLATDYKGWVYDEGVHCLRNAPMNEPGILFANGGQLYATNEMFNEIAGIGFKRSMDDPEDAKLMNRSVGIHSGSLELNADEGMFHKLVLPKVPANGVVYVRATPIKNASLVTKCSVDGVTKKTFDKTIEIPMGDNKKDYVYIMKNNAEQDVELWLNGLSVQKIAVSTDFKKIGSTGYATESRDHIIDHTLTEFFTGLPIKAYYGKLSDDKKSVSLEKVEFLKAAAAEGDATGCILHNETSGTSKAVNIIDGGFHLFVPDMHDKGSNNIDGNVLLAHLGSDNIKNTSDVTRYVLANQWYSPTTGEALNTDPTVVRFVKVDHKNGAKLSANSAYMELSKEAGAKIASIMLFYDESEEPSGEATGIVTVNHENDKDGIWYNLSGLPIEAPCKAGIYIRNGKKVVVK